MPTRAEQRQNVETNIAILNAITPDGFTWTHNEIAEITGCSRGLIFNIEYEAKRKLKNDPVMRQIRRELKDG